MFLIYYICDIDVSNHNDGRQWNFVKLLGHVLSILRIQIKIVDPKEEINEIGRGGRGLFEQWKPLKSKMTPLSGVFLSTIQTTSLSEIDRFTIEMIFGGIVLPIPKCP